MEALQFREIDLPHSFTNIISSKDDEVIKIRSSVKNIREIDEWINVFSKQTETSWIMRSSQPHETTKLLCRKDYACQHSNFKKKAPQGLKKQKNFECPASIHAVIKLTTASTRKKDKFVKDGLPAKFSIKLQHSHNLKTAAALGYLRPQKEMRTMFENYFQNGLNVAESIKFHEATFEEDPDFEVSIASARNMPKERTISYWHDEWRKLNFGTRTGDDIFEVMTHKQRIYEEKGIKIMFQKNPLAIVIVTPLMQRAHMLPFAKHIVFVDSTATCNVENYTVTFLLTPCAAGAVPMGVVITSGQTMENYKAGFELFQKTVCEPFGGNGFSVNFMTDDSDAERDAIKAVWKESNRFLCHFHVSQAVWRWLRSKENDIDANDRQCLYKSFKCIMVATTEEEANACNKESVKLAAKYPNWKKYIENYWEKKEEWALVWRNIFLHNNQTNNYCEASVRLFKDVVLCRNKAYNVVALIDYTSIPARRLLCIKRLRKFAHSRCEKPRLALNHKISKAAYVSKHDIKRDMNSNLFHVHSEKTVSLYHSVDPKDGSCTCPSGLFGGFCKHQAAVFLHYSEYTASMPGITAEARYEMAILAFGKNAKCPTFYEPLAVLKKDGSSSSTLPTSVESSSKDDFSNEDAHEYLELVMEHEEVVLDAPAVNGQAEATDDDINAFLEASNFIKKFHNS